MIKFNRIWAMPNKNTFSIKPINDLVLKLCKDKYSVDPFSNGFRYASITNDLDPKKDADFNLDAIDFLRLQKSNCFDVVLFDPPYSPRQISEHYKKLDMTVNMQTTQSIFWSKLKKEISRIVKKDGVVLTCCWNSGGVGKKYGFSLSQVLLVPHGGWHNDTICVVEKYKP